MNPLYFQDSPWCTPTNRHILHVWCCPFFPLANKMLQSRTVCCPLPDPGYATESAKWVISTPALIPMCESNLSVISLGRGRDVSWFKVSLESSRTVLHVFWITLHFRSKHQTLCIKRFTNVGGTSGKSISVVWIHICCKSLMFKKHCIIRVNYAISNIYIQPSLICTWWFTVSVGSNKSTWIFWSKLFTADVMWKIQMLIAI